MVRTMNLQKDAESTFIDLLVTDLDLAMTFLDVAQTTQSVENAERNHRNAQKAYDEVIAKLQAVTLGEKEQTRLERKLALLRARLRANRKQS